VTPAEAANHLGLSNYEDLDEAVEMNLFQCRQELIQKADHVLLFPAKEKRLKLLQIASETLGFVFEQIVYSKELDGSHSNRIEDQFHCFQANRSRLLKEAGQVNSFLGLVHVQEQLKRNYQVWSLFWNDMKSINPQEVKLSEIVDSMRFLQVINQWKEQGLEEIHQLGSADIPMDIQLEILRLQQVSEKLT
jgi:hypothetical protein